MLVAYHFTPQGNQAGGDTVTFNWDFKAVAVPTVPKGSPPLQLAELDQGNRVNGWVIHTFFAIPFSHLAC